jgi:hypothetical protein
MVYNVLERVKENNCTELWMHEILEKRGGRRTMLGNYVNPKEG